jgi:hypothetical protein
MTVSEVVGAASGHRFRRDETPVMTGTSESRSGAGRPGRRPKSSAFTAFQQPAAPQGVTTLIHKKKRGNSERSANVSEYGPMHGRRGINFIDGESRGSVQRLHTAGETVCDENNNTSNG